MGTKTIISVSIDKEVFKKIEEERDGLSRSSFVELSLRKYMNMGYPLRE